MYLKAFKGFLLTCAVCLWAAASSAQTPATPGASTPLPLGISNFSSWKFEQVGESMQVAAVGWAYGPCLADLDNDGWLDLYATAGFVSKDRDDPDG